MTPTIQNLTEPTNQTEVDVIPIPYSELSPAQQAWVDYNVIQGVVVESDGEMRKVTVTDFANQIGYSRQACYDWSKNIPNFWDLVNDRRKEIFAGARTAKVYNALFLAATVKLNPQAIAIWLANSGIEFRMPQQKVEHELGGGFADLLNRARQDRQKGADVVEGEVVSEPITND